MANTKKKNPARRVPRSATPRTFGDGQPVAEATKPVPGSVGQPLEAAGMARGMSDLRRRVAQRSEVRPQLPLREEYRYVPTDLKRLAMLALGMLVLMAVLGIIIH